MKVIDKALFTKGVALEYRAVALVLLSAFLMFADRRFDTMQSLRFALAYAATPVYWVADLPARTSDLMDDVFVSHTELVVENSRLRNELLLAQRELQVLESLASENNRLLALDEATRIVEGEVVAAEIINQSPDRQSKKVLINRGAQDGVFVGQAMLAADGLMGQVVEVMPRTSWVLLVTDPLHVTPVEVNRNGERALARGLSGASDQLELEFVTQTQDVRVGDLLISSGMGQVFPKNYPVADVVSVLNDPGQDFTVVRARPRAQLNSTRHVMLLRPSEVEPDVRNDYLDDALTEEAEEAVTDSEHDESREELEQGAQE